MKDYMGEIMDPLEEKKLDEIVQLYKRMEKDLMYKDYEKIFEEIKRERKRLTEEAENILRKKLKGVFNKRKMD
ncbi:MAG TPA: hypothetical protein VK031_00230 [Tissierellaceae bacterium]|nr:hypothetical protein [Tissierellaceae bacterium]